MATNLSSLPVELQTMIAEFLPLSDLKDFSAVNKRLRKASSPVLFHTVHISGFAAITHYISFLTLPRNVTKYFRRFFLTNTIEQQRTFRTHPELNVRIERGETMLLFIPDNVLTSAILSCNRQYASNDPNADSMQPKYPDLAHFFRLQKNLKELSLHINPEHATACHGLSDAAKHLHKLRMVSLHEEIELTDEAEWQPWAQFIGNLPALKHLRLIDYYGAGHLWEFLKAEFGEQGLALTSLDLVLMNIPIQLSGSLAFNPRYLQRLVMEDCGRCSHFIRKLAAIPLSLKEFVYAADGLGGESHGTFPEILQALTALLLSFTGLRSLYLCDEAVNMHEIPLAAFINHSNTLEQLGVQGSTLLGELYDLDQHTTLFTSCTKLKILHWVMPDITVWPSTQTPYGSSQDFRGIELALSGEFVEYFDIIHTMATHPALTSLRILSLPSANPFFPFADTVIPDVRPLFAAAYLHHLSSLAYVLAQRLKRIGGLASPSGVSPLRTISFGAVSTPTRPVRREVYRVDDHPVLELDYEVVLDWGIGGLESGFGGRVWPVVGLRVEGVERDDLGRWFGGLGVWAGVPELGRM